MTDLEWVAFFTVVGVIVTVGAEIYMRVCYDRDED